MAIGPHEMMSGLLMRINMTRVKKIPREIFDRLYILFYGSKKFKNAGELEFWKKKAHEGPLRNKKLSLLFTKPFGLDDEFYRNRKILDIGCGPRGSLEWADSAAERVGLDPLADSYKELGADQHKMKYVKGVSESIPFEDGYFDIVTSFNSLDHVDDLDRTVKEIKRVIAPGGEFLLLVEVNHPPTRCEPVFLSWDITGKFTDEMELIDEKQFEINSRHAMFASIEEARMYDHSNLEKRTGILLARFHKKNIST